MLCHVVLLLCARVRIHVSITHGERIKDVERFMYVCVYVEGLKVVKRTL